MILSDFLNKSKNLDFGKTGYEWEFSKEVEKSCSKWTGRLRCDGH